MQELYKDLGEDFQCSNFFLIYYIGFSFKVLLMDVRSMTFESETFDCVIDKGTLDTVLVNKNYIFLITLFF